MSLTRTGRDLARRVIFFQSALTVIVSMLYMLFVDANAAISALLGGLLSVLPNLIFSFFAFRFAGASKNKLVVRSFNQGSKLKIFSTIMLFIMVYQWAALNPIVLLVSYVVVLLSQWPVIMFIHKTANK